MDIDKKFATDAAKEKDGVWHEIGDGAAVKIARLNNPNYQRIMRAKFKSKEKQLQLRTLADEVAEKLYVEVIAETILVDWRGFTRGGKPLKYSREAAIDVLTRLKDFRDLVVSLAESAEAFRAEQQADAEKNSETSSASA